MSQGEKVFLRKKKNKSGKISVQIIDKSTGKYKVLKTIGCSSHPEQLERYIKEGRDWIKSKLAQLEIDFVEEKKQIDGLLNNIEQINIKGTELLIGKIYEEIGFDKIEEELLKQLVMSRICFPVSKLKTTEYLYRYHCIEIDVDRIYRYLDKLIKHQKERIQQLSYEHTLEILSSNIRVKSFFVCKNKISHSITQQFCMRFYYHLLSQVPSAFANGVAELSQVRSSLSFAIS